MDYKESWTTRSVLFEFIKSMLTVNVTNSGKKFLFQAYNLLGQFLLLNKDEELFKEWLKEEAGVKGKHVNDCNNCMAEWTRSYV